MPELVIPEEVEVKVGSKVPWTWDWAKFLAKHSGETITSATVVQIDSETAITIDTPTNDNTTVTTVLSGWVADKDYSLKCTITTTPSTYTEPRTVVFKARA